MEPTLAERARTLLHLGRTATLSTNSIRRPGWPFGSMMPYAVADSGEPLLLVSRLAVHAKNLAADPRASVFVSQPELQEEALAGPRLTLLGTVEAGDAPRSRELYLARHPRAAAWLDFQDFNLCRLAVTDVYFVAGFGGMGWIAADEFRAAQPDPLAGDAVDIVYQANLHWGPSIVKLAAALSGEHAHAARVASIDRFGFRIAYEAGGTEHELRVPFPHPVRDPAEARQALSDRIGKQSH